MIKRRKGNHRETENETDERKKGVKKVRKAETFAALEGEPKCPNNELLCPYIRASFSPPQRRVVLQ